MSDHHSWPQWWPRAIMSGVIFIAAVWLYLTTAAPGLIVGGGIESESAQLQRAAYRLGIAHSTGYPIYTIIGYSAGRLADAFGHDPYTWITYTSSVTSAIALVLFFHLSLTIGNPPLALAATGLLAVTGTVWHLSTIAETQGLHAISIIGILWLIVIHLRYPQKFTPLAGLALLGGIGLANHRTVVISGSVAALAIVLTDAWKRVSRRQWVILLTLVVLPTLSYGYIFWRASDPHVVMGVRESWRPSYIPYEEDGFLLNYILGTELNFNVQFPWHDFGERLRFVVSILRDQLTTLGLLAGTSGLAFLAIGRKRLGMLLAIYIVGWAFFLMSWRLDWKATIYYQALLVPFIIGMIHLASWLAKKLLPSKPKKYRSAILGSVFSLPLFALFFWTYDANREDRNLSDNRSGDRYIAQMETIPQDTMVFSGGWSTDSFILLEYMDLSGREDISIPVNCVDSTTGCWFDDVIRQSTQHDRTIYLSPRVQSWFAMHTESFLLPQRGVAISGTGTNIFVQVRPKHDPRLQLEAETAAYQLDLEIAPEIRLASHSLVATRDGIELTIYWQATTPPEVRYSTYTHLRHYGAECQSDLILALLSQDDSRDPVDGHYPTTFWETGELVKDTYFISWPAEPVPSQGVAVTIGMTQNGQRMEEYCLPLQVPGESLIDFETLGVSLRP